MKQVKYLTDLQGNKTAVVLPIEEWKTIQRELEYGIPDWHKGILEARENELALPGKTWAEVKTSLRRKG
jgi:hypothetical protein